MFTTLKQKKDAWSAPVRSLGRYLAFCWGVACRTSWLMHKLLWAPYDSATEPDARLSSCQDTNEYPLRLGTNLFAGHVLPQVGCTQADKWATQGSMDKCKVYLHGDTMVQVAEA